MYFRIVCLYIILCLFSPVIRAQNVGIGTNMPEEKLDVSGNIVADTLKGEMLRLFPNASSGKVLTSDDVGNGTWQELSIQNDPEDGNIGYGVWGDCQTNANISAYQPVTDTTAGGYEYFGYAVALSGDDAVVGAVQAGTSHVDNNFELYLFGGSCLIFQRFGLHWNKWQTVFDPVGESGASIISCAIDGNSKRFVIGIDTAPFGGKVLFGKIN